jgi:hypothetical protein
MTPLHPSLIPLFFTLSKNKGIREGDKVDKSTATKGYFENKGYQVFHKCSILFILCHLIIRVQKCDNAVIEEQARVITKQTVIFVGINLHFKVFACFHEG